MKILFIFLIANMMSTTVVAESLSNLLKNRDVIFRDGALQQPVVPLKDSPYTFDLSGNPQFIEKRNSSFLSEFDKYRVEVTRTKEGQLQRITEASIDNFHVGVDRDMITYVFSKEGRITSRTSCSQVTRSNTYPVTVWRDEKLRCTTFTKEFCKIAKEKLSKLKAEHNEADINKCTSILLDATRGLGELAKTMKKNKTYEGLASKESALMSKKGIAMGVELEGPPVLFTENKVNDSGAKAIGHHYDGAYSSFKALDFIEYLENTCNKMHGYFENLTKFQAPPKKKRRGRASKAVR